MTDSHAFRHVPMLHGKIQDPETSRFRDMHDRYAELDRAAAEQGRENWRLSHEAREATRVDALAGREGRDVWVFGYGSLIWDPAVRFDEVRRAVASGFRRRFCMHLEGGRGSPERPGLMASLDRTEGRICDGVALRIPAARVTEETRIMWMREMITGAYVPAFIPLSTPQGDIEALAFLVKHGDERYCDCSDAEAARRIAFAEGTLGTNLEYLAQLVRHLDMLGIHDAEMTDLHAAVMSVRQAQA
jgi:cation transport protein ChaC